MNANEIDEVIKAMADEDINRVIELIAEEPVYGNIEEFFGKVNREVPKKVMAKIEEGDFEYFLSKINDDEYKHTCLELLLYSTKTEEIKKILDQKDKIGFIKRGMLFELIGATKDPDYIKDILENREKEFQISLGIEKVQLLIKSGDSEYIKDILEDDKKRYELRIIDKDHIEKLIIATGDIDYIKSIIENKEKQDKFYLSSLNICELIKATGDSQYIESILDNEEKLEEFNFRPDKLHELIKATNDPKYIEKIVENSEKRLKFGLYDRYLKDIIKSTGDIEYIKTLAENKFGLDSLDVLEMILATANSEDIKEILNNQELKEKLNIKGSIEALFVTHTKDLDYIEEYLERKENEYEKKRIDSKIDLPEELTIGIEIESEGEYSEAINNLYNIIAEKWKCVRDGSLNDGVEVVSPILKGDNEKTTKQIEKVCRRLQALRTNSIRKMWRTYTYWFRLFNNDRELE